MDAALVLAKFWGIVMVVFGAVFLLRPAAAREILTLGSDPKFSVVSGLVALLIGAASVAVYGDWSNDWRLALTLIGWSAVLKGIVRLGFGSGTAAFTQRVGVAGLRWWLVPILLAGLWLLGKGYAVSMF